MALQGPAASGRREDSRGKEMQVVLLGDTGTGKSTTGNTILGEKKFKSSSMSKSTTQSCESYPCHRFKEYISVTDVPGFTDTNKTKEQITADILECLVYASPGIHAILYVIKIGRYTESHENTFERFLQLFGPQSLEFVIGVFTGLDELEDDGDTLDDFIKNASPLLRNFLDKTKNRYIAVNNKRKDGNAEFVQELLEQIKRIIASNNGKVFTNTMLKQADKLVAKTGSKRVVVSMIYPALVGAASGAVSGMAGGAVAGPIGAAVGAFVGSCAGFISGIFFR